MDLYSNNDWRYYNSLAHHGILKQKWGVRNGPPYPLDRATHNRVVSGKAKASGNQENKSRKSSHDSLANDILDRVTSSKLMNKKFISDIANKYSEKLAQKHDEEWEEVTETTRNGKKVYENVADILDKNPNAYKKTPPPNWSDKNINRIMAEASRTNPDYPEDGSTMNCTKCVLAFELRKRGYDLQAGRTDIGMPYPYNYTYWFGLNRDTFGRNAAMGKKGASMIENAPPNSSGVMSVTMNDLDFVHVVHWSKTKEGKLLIIDPQSASDKSMPSKWNSIEEACKDMDASIISQDCAIRLDNLEPDFSEIAEDSGLRLNNGSRSKLRNKRSGKVVDSW